jgi:hypothetical protein
MSNIVAIDANYALDLEAGSAYRESNVYPYLQSKRFTMDLWVGPLATRANAEASAVEPDAKLLTGVGHGFPASFLGDNQDPVWAVGAYAPQEVSGRIAHFLSCSNAQTLGPDFVKHGCAAYIGYDNNFIYDPNNADAFFACDGEIDRALADGLTVGAAVTRAISVFRKTIDDLNAQGDSSAAGMLAQSLSYLRSPLNNPKWGDVNATL